MSRPLCEVAWSRLRAPRCNFPGMGETVISVASLAAVALPRNPTVEGELSTAGSNATLSRPACRPRVVCRVYANPGSPA